MKKITAFLLVFMMALALVACGGKGGNDPEPGKEPVTKEQETTGKDTSEEKTTGDTQPSKKTVINDGSKLGELQPIAQQQDFVIKGLYISSESGQHEYPHVDDVETFETTGLNSEFELNEWIGFYVDTERKTPLNIYIVRNDMEADYAKITGAELRGICVEKEYPRLLEAVPDEENKGYLGEAYAHPELTEPDLYNVFFVADGKVCYMVQLNIVPENTVE